MSHSIELLADEQILITEGHLPATVSLTRFDPANGIPENAANYDALFVRTVSPIDKTTISGSPKKLRFIGSATAGFDHVDQEWLASQNITFAYAPGCNASSVGEYISVALLIWALKTETDLSALTVGIIGAGHTGSAVAKHLTNLGIDFKSYDPPKQERETSFTSAGLDEILECDLLTFHTPLTDDGDWPTRHWLDKNKLEDRTFDLIINAARGSVVDEKSLLKAYRNGTVRNYILDVWENEPLFNDLVAENALLRTPHIAGYSLQSKQRASDMIIKSFCRFFGLPDTKGNRLDETTNRPQVRATEIEPDLLQMLLKLHPIGEYDKRFKTMIGINPNLKPRAFQDIRTGYPLRQEHPWILLAPEILETFPVLRTLGFCME